MGYVRKYMGFISLRIGRRAHEWPCDFTEVPSSPLEAAAGQTELYAVLGRAGFLDHYAVSIDAGYLTITRLGPIRCCWRYVLHTLWSWARRTREASQPI